MMMLMCTERHKNWFGHKKRFASASLGRLSDDVSRARMRRFEKIKKTSLRAPNINLSEISWSPMFSVIPSLTSRKSRTCQLQNRLEFALHNTLIKTYFNKSSLIDCKGEKVVGVY